MNAESLRTLSIALSLTLSSTVQADRALYTIELAQGATHIGVWQEDNISTRNGSLQLGHPDAILKGKPQELHEASKQSDRLTKAIAQIQLKGTQLLFIHIDGERVDLVGDSGAMTLNGITRKAVDEIIELLAMQKAWGAMPASKQIDQSDIIVQGQVAQTAAECRKAHTLIPTETLKGPQQDKLSVQFITDKSFNTKHLFFLRRNPGTGPRYLVMHSTSTEDSKRYLTLLNKGRL